MYSVEDLIAFVNIVEKGSVTGAANSMDLDPATVSRRLSKLEAKLGVSLIKRSTRRMAITAEGSLFHRHAIVAIRLLRQAEQSMLGTEGESVQNTIAIAGPNWLIQGFLVAGLQKLVVSQDVTLELVAANTSDVLPSQATICLSVGPFAVTSEHQVCLLKNRTILCASPGYLELHSGVSNSQELASRTCIASRANQRWALKSAAGSTTTIAAGSDLLCDDDMMLLSLALAGQGVVALNSVQAEKALLAGELIEVLPRQFQELDRDIYLHCDASQFARPGVESCYKAIQQMIVSPAVGASVESTSGSYIS